MSYQAVKYVLQHSSVYGNARLVLISLAEHTNVDGFTWPSMDLLARECRMSKTGVHNSLKLLLHSREIIIAQRGGPRSSAKYLMIRFLETPNVGAPTVQILREPGERIFRDLTVLGGKNRVYSVPAEQVYPKLLAVSTVSDDTAGGTDCTQEVPNEPPKKRPGVPQRYSGHQSTVLSVTDDTGTIRNHQVTVPAFQSGNRNHHHSPAAAACASSGAADGLSLSTPSSSRLRPTYPPSHESRSPRALRTMREILRHAADAANGDAPFDFVGPDYSPDEEEK